MPAATNIVDLRRLLAERFPQAHARTQPAVPPGQPTDVPALDQMLGGGLPRGGISELVGAGPGSGSVQVLHSLLRRVAADGQFLALVDGADSFDLAAVEADVLARLLWIRCAKADEALKAADLLLRDRNVPLVILDLKLNPAHELRKISASVWFRFSRIAEHNGTTLLVITPDPLVGACRVRVRVASRLGVAALIAGPAAVQTQLHFELLRAADGETRNDEVEVG